MNEVVTTMREVYRLTDWYISLEAIEGEDWDSNAYVTFDREEKRATIHYAPNVTARDIRHEMTHVLLHDLVYLASNGRTVEMMDMVSLVEERLCNVLADVADY